MNVKIAGEIGKVQLSLAFPDTFSLNLPRLPPQLTPSVFLIKVPSVKQGEVRLMQGEWVMGLSFSATSNADVHISHWHRHTLREPLHTHTIPTDVKDDKQRTNQTGRKRCRFTQSSLAPQQTWDLC